MSTKPTPRDVLAHTFRISLEYELGKQVEEVADNLADIAVKALKDAGFGFWRQMDEKDEKDEW